MKQIFALVDCNSFFCSCERIFRPELRNKPVIVLSANDGCIISLSREAKKLGLEMGGAYFEVRQKCLQNKVTIFSTNFALYADISHRVMQIIQEGSPESEIYSVDEAFLDLTEHLSPVKFSSDLKKRILQTTSIPVSIGIATTKVLAKLANRLAKHDENLQGIIEIDHSNVEEALKLTEIEDVWGIGRESSQKLKALGIHTALQFRDFENIQLIQKILTKRGRQIQDELRGISCLGLEDVEPKKMILSSRSFGQLVRDKESIGQAIAHFVTIAAEKLREQNSVCRGLGIYIRTSRFNNTPYYLNQTYRLFQTGGSDTLFLISQAMEMLDEIYKTGFDYKKASAYLFDLTSADEYQLNFFEDKQRNNQISQLLDRINGRYGERVVQSLACGINPQWRPLSEHRSQRYTTNLKEICKIKI